MKGSRTIWLSAALIVGMLYVLIAFVFYITGNWGPVENAYIAEVGICLTDTQYKPVTKVPSDIEEIYLCGKVKGMTNYDIALHIFYEEQQRAIYDDFLKLRPGTFFWPLHLRDGLQPGRYRAELGRERKTLHEVTFEVVE